ncbi:hypothetical protein QQP08_016926 [Theobroma cacao]|nr:hypothetical protein QQP08_016926 [Theobroma cacao]
MVTGHRWRDKQTIYKSRIFRASTFAEKVWQDGVFAGLFNRATDKTKGRIENKTGGSRVVSW